MRGVPGRRCVKRLSAALHTGEAGEARPCALCPFRGKIKPIGYEAKLRPWEERAVCRGSVIPLNTRQRHKETLTRRQKGKKGTSHVERTTANKTIVIILAIINSMYSASRCISTSIRIHWFAFNRPVRESKQEGSG